MNRRELLFSLPLAQVLGPAASTDDEAALKQAIRAIYDAYSRTRDKVRYRALLADGYLLLENGKLMDADGDVAGMRDPKEPYQRTDSFDFKHVRVAGDLGYLVYFLDSEIRDRNGSQRRKWLESAVFRRAGPSWRLAVLHSTEIVAAGR